MGSPCKKSLAICIVLLSAVFLFQNAYGTTVKDIIQKYGKSKVRDFIRDTAPDRQITIQIQGQLYKKKGRQDIDFLSIRSIEADFRWLGLSPADADRALESYQTGTQKTAVIESAIYGNDPDSINAVLKRLSLQKAEPFPPEKNRLSTIGVFKDSNYPDPDYPLAMPAVTVADLIRKHGKYKIRNFITGTAPEKQITIQLADRFYLKHGLQDVQYVSIASIEKDLYRLGLSLSDADNALGGDLNGSISGTDHTISAGASPSKNTPPRKTFASPEAFPLLNSQTAVINDMIHKYGKYNIREFIKKKDANNVTSIQVGNQFFLRHGRHDINYITALSIQRDFNRMGLSPREAGKALKTYLEREGKDKSLAAQRDQQNKNTKKAGSFNEVVHEIFDSQIIDDASFSDGLGYIIFRQDENYFGTEYQIHKIATIDSARLFYKLQPLKSIKMLVLLNFDTDFYAKGLYILNVDRNSFESEYGLEFNSELNFQQAFVEKFTTNETILHFGKKFINHVSTGESTTPPSNTEDKVKEPQ